MSHFAFLKDEFPSVYEAAIEAEVTALSKPRNAAVYSRRAVELAVKWAYKHDAYLRLPYQDNLSALIHEPSFRDLAGKTILAKLKVIIKLGNQAVHSERPIRQYDAVSVIRELTHVTYWLAKTYTRGNVLEAPVFDETCLPQSDGHIKDSSANEVKRLNERLAASDEKLSEILADRNRLDDELIALRAEIAEAKVINRLITDSHDYNETQTRDYFIDLLLLEAGWPLDQDRDREYEITGMPNDTGKGYVDYVLWGDDGKPLGLVEAKRARRDPRIGQHQAKLYADCLEAETGQRPVIFYSNGYDHYIWDDVMHPPRSVQGFLKKEELELAIQRRESRTFLNADDVGRGIIDRPYQIRAIQRIAESFQKENRRKALLVMATGTGKTRTIIALSDLLMKANWAKRILFLADRVALVNQAVNAFKDNLPSVAVVNLVNNRHEEGRVYVSTYQSMMRLIDGKSGDTRKFGAGHFDLVIIDEAHRSVYQKYRAIFDYFDSYLVGLTATPREDIDRNTYNLFDLEEGVPTDAYTLEEAIEDGYLVPPELQSVSLKFPREGIRYNNLSEEEKEQWDALEWTDDGTKPDEVSAEAVNNWLFNKDTADKVIAHFMKNGIKVAGGDRLGKTIIFARNHKHAEFIKERFDVGFPNLKGDFARVITFKTNYAQDLINKFSIREEEPHIAVSVDMLDTGIDIPEVVNLVLAKAVYSKTKFWQMIGRGTRLCPDLLGPSKDKTEFRVFDFCGNLEYFGLRPDEPLASIPETLAEKLFRLRMELIQAIDETRTSSHDDVLSEPATNYDSGMPDEQQIRNSTAAQLLDTIKAMDKTSFIVQDKRKYVEKYETEAAWQTIDHIMIGEVLEHIAHLPSSVSDPDVKAKMFDVLCLNLQLCILKALPGFKSYADRVMKIAESLIEYQEVPAVKAQLPLLTRVTDEEYWSDISVPMLEVLRVRLRSLVKHISNASHNVIFTDFEDEIGEQSVVNLTQSVQSDLAKFRQKIRAFLQQERNNISLNKLRMNKPLTATDIQELERLFLQASIGDRNLLDKAAEQSNGLGPFIRSLIGLDRKAAQAMFSDFTDGRKLSGDQYQFIKLIIDYLTEHGTVHPSALYESPFTHTAPTGPESLFSKEDIVRIFETLEQVNQNALPEADTAISAK